MNRTVLVRQVRHERFEGVCSLKTPWIDCLSVCVDVIIIITTMEQERHDSIKTRVYCYAASLHMLLLPINEVMRSNKSRETDRAHG